jgi:zinc transporter 9
MYIDGRHVSVKFSLLSCICLTSSFAFGMIPFYFSLSPERVHLISTFGTGILVGTALIVIIPEGARALFQGERDPDSDRKIIGGSLITGFMIMYLIDAIPEYIVSRRNEDSASIDMSNLRFSRVGGGDDIELQESSEGVDSHQAQANENSKNKIAKSTKLSIGLIIHSIADGIALGAAIVSGDTELETLVFLAILIHKAPASFGLTSVLLRHGLEFKNIRINLGLFAAAAPAGALLTYAITTLLWGIGVSMDVVTFGAILLVFSGGTFLYVAVHAMQDLESHGAKDSSADKGAAILLLSIGMTVPLLTFLLPGD